jgi:hypothetical protein
MLKLTLLSGVSLEWSHIDGMSIAASGEKTMKQHAAKSRE